MLPRRRALEAEVLRYCHALHARGWVANHDGNITARLDPNRFLATPTAFSKADVEAAHLLVVDDHGKKVSGLTKPFSEMPLHLYVMAQRPDVNAVIHAHPPYATAFAVAGKVIDPAIIAEAVVSLGDSIPLVPFAAPKSCETTLNLIPVVQQVDAVALENHGVLTWGPDLTTAFLRLELVEHLATIQAHAVALGGARRIPAAHLPALLEARTKAGLGRAARQQCVAASARKGSL